MKRVVERLYSEPVVFLGLLQVVLTTLAAAHVITGWIPVVSLAAVVYLQRELVRPVKGKR